MIIRLSRLAAPEQARAVLARIEALGFKHDVIHGSTGIDVIGVLGETKDLETDVFEEMAGVEKVVRVSRPYKLVSREYHPKDRVVELGAVRIGGGGFTLMAGPCSVEGRDQILRIAEYVQGCGGEVLRGGAYKPRTSPYSFQGLGAPGLSFLAEARERFGLKIVTEATGNHRHAGRDGRTEERTVLENVLAHADIVQVGTRNMKAYGFLLEIAEKTAGRKAPILLKRGEAATIEDFLLAAEYLAANGNPNVILCLRGIRTFEEPKFQRYTPDLGAIAVLKRECNLPVVFDPSQATGDRDLVHPVSLAAVAAGADGLIVETHYDPQNALSDGRQSVTPEVLARIARDCRRLHADKDAGGTRA